MNRSIRLITSLLVLLYSGLSHCLAATDGLPATEPADLVFTGGKIVTVDGSFSIADSLAVRGGKIVAVGRREDIQAHIAPGTEVVQLAGRMVLPGLIDSHVHAVSAAKFEYDHAIPPMRSIADVLQYIRARAKVVPEGEWIQLEQVFVTRLDERRFPTRRELDEAAPNHPVIYRTGPDAALNSLALLRSGIDREFELPQDVIGRIERDPQSGEPTGVIRGGATRFVKIQNDSRRQPTREEAIARLQQLMADYNSVGITSISDRNADEEIIAIYRTTHERGEATCRVFLFKAVDANAPLADIQQQLETAARDPLHQYHPMIWLRGVKVFLDGGMLTGSALMREPWGLSRIYSISDPDYYGERKIDPERLYHVSRLALNNGFQMTAHAVGDGAVDALLDAYEEVSREIDIREHRPCITHANFMSREAIERMQRLGVVADLQPAWLWLDGATLREHFGERRLELFQPYKALLESGVIIGAGSDHMQKIGSMRSVNPYNPFLGMWITLRRLPQRSNEPLHPEQIINREQAIRLYTINNAYLSFEEHSKGSLEVGKWADLIIVDRDLLNCPIDEIKDAQVLATYLGGKRVYHRELDGARP